jgi:peptide/nickel transport system permease protein
LEETIRKRRRGLVARVGEVIFTVLLKKNRSRVGIAILLAYVVLIVLVPHFIPYSPYDSTGLPNRPPSSAHPFGTDSLGRDVLIETITGAYSSIPIGIFTAIGAVLLGFVVGIFAGYYNRLEGPFTGVADTVMTFPPLPLMLLLGSLFPPTDLLLTVIMIVVLWPPIARSIRSQILSLRSMPFVDAAKTSGLTDFQIIRKVLVPQVASIAFAYFVLTVALSIVLVSALQFLGVGNPDIISWGSMLYFAQQFAFYSGDWWWILAPGLSITAVAMGLALIGFSFEETMNPRLRA